MSEEGGSKTTEEKISEITEPVIDDVPIANLGQGTGLPASALKKTIAR